MNLINIGVERDQQANSERLDAASAAGNENFALLLAAEDPSPNSCGDKLPISPASADTFARCRLGATRSALNASAWGPDSSATVAN